MLTASALSWLRNFEVAARYRNLTHAAAELCVTPGAVSQQVKQLEAHLCQPLFYRRARGLELTAAGGALAKALHNSFSSIETVLQEIRSSTSGSGLTLTCCPSFALGWLIPRLGEFCHAHSDVSIKIQPSLLNFPDKSIASASIQYAKKSAAMGTFFMSEWLLPVASPSFVDAHPELESCRTLHPDWLLHDDAPWIEAEVFDEWRMWYSLTGQELPDLQFGQRFAESQMAIAAALSGHGVALGRVALVFDDIASGKLIPVYENLVESPAAYYFASATSNSPARCIASWLRVEGRRFEATVAEQFSASCATSVPPP